MGGVQNDKVIDLTVVLSRPNFHKKSSSDYVFGLCFKTVDQLIESKATGVVFNEG